MRWNRADVIENGKKNKSAPTSRCDSFSHTGVERKKEGARPWCPTRVPCRSHAHTHTTPPPMDVDLPPTAGDGAPSAPLALAVFATVRQGQAQHGLRQGDYKRYRCVLCVCREWRGGWLGGRGGVRKRDCARSAALVATGALVPPPSWPRPPACERVKTGSR